MLIFFTDESRVEGADAREYQLSIYGGLILDEDTFRDLTTFLYQAKERYVLPQEVEVKWSNVNVLENMKRIGRINKNMTRQTHPNFFKSFKDDYDKFKEEILEKVSNSSAKIIVAIRPNRLLRTSNERNIEYSIGAVARKFEKLLEKKDKYGIILADELPRKVRKSAVMDYEYVIDLCCHGSNSVSFKRLISIVPTIDSNASPIHQINDVVLGAVQYYILEFIRKIKNPAKNIDLAKSLFGKLTENFYKSADGRYTTNSGVLLYPPKNTRRNTRAGVFLDALEGQLKSDFNIL